jgi:hypothetical protein
MSINVETEKNAVERASKLLEGIPGGMQKAMTRALNRALQEGRTAGTREVTRRYTVKAKEVRPTFKMHKASNSNLEAELSSTGQKLPLSSFTHRPNADTTGANRKQIRVGVKKGGLKPLGQGFMWRGKVMQRLGQTRLPVEQKYGPAVPSMLDNEEIVDKVVDTMGNAVDKRLDHETNRILEGGR